MTPSSVMQDIGFHKNDLDSRVDDEGRDIEDPKEAIPNS